MPSARVNAFSCGAFSCSAFSCKCLQLQKCLELRCLELQSRQTAFQQQEGAADAFSVKPSAASAFSCKNAFSCSASSGKTSVAEPSALCQTYANRVLLWLLMGLPTLLPPSISAADASSCKASGCKAFSCVSTVCQPVLLWLSMGLPTLLFPPPISARRLPVIVLPTPPHRQSAPGGCPSSSFWCLFFVDGPSDTPLTINTVNRRQADVRHRRFGACVLSMGLPTLLSPSTPSIGARQLSVIVLLVIVFCLSRQV